MIAVEWWGFVDDEVLHRQAVLWAYIARSKERRRRCDELIKLWGAVHDRSLRMAQGHQVWCMICDGRSDADIVAFLQSGCRHL